LPSKLAGEPGEGAPRTDGAKLALSGNCADLEVGAEEFDGE
jgi:hypothetical protein